jgi:hypothetical protein
MKKSFVFLALIFFFLLLSVPVAGVDKNVAETQDDAETKAAVQELASDQTQTSAPVRQGSSMPDHAHLQQLSELLNLKQADPSQEFICPTSDALDQYLEGLYRLQLHVRDKSRSEIEESEATVSEEEGIRMRDGIWIVEGDDTILAHDHPADLLGKSLRFTPSMDGYNVMVESLQYDANVGKTVLYDSPYRLYVQIGLPYFNFPMGGNSYNMLYAGTDFSVRTNNPLGVEVFSGVQYTITSATADLFTDRADRLSPLYFAVGDNWGRYLYVRNTPQKLLITWRTSTYPPGDTFHVDVQAALYPNGEILFSYQTLKNVNNGAPHVYSGIQSWLDGFTTKATITDPIEGLLPEADIVEVTLEEDPSSDIMHVRTTMAGSIPGSHPDQIEYWVILSQESEIVYRFYTWVDSKGRNDLWIYSERVNSFWRLGRPTISGAVWDVLFSLSDLPDLSAGPIEIQVTTYLEDELLDDVILSTDISGGAPFERDYTAEVPFYSTIPTVEAFLFPWFLTHGVKDKLLSHTGWDEPLLDCIPMYQNFFTELELWAGGYYTYGNCGAANMGLCEPDEPLRPGLLHMNKVNHGMNNATDPIRFLVLSHEFGHHWLQLVDIDEGSGPSDILNPISAHPAGYVDTKAVQDLVYAEDSSVMGGGYWIDNGDGTYSTPPYNTYYSYSAYELYLMGLMDPAEVIDWFYLDNTDPAQPLAYWAQVDATVTGDYHHVTIQMLLDAMGLRDPVYPDSRQDLFTPMVLVVRPGDEPSVEDWEFMMSVRDPWRESFQIQTDDRGSLTTISPREVSPAGATQLRLEKTETGLRFYFEDPEFSDQVGYNIYEGALNGVFNDWAPLTCGEAANGAGGGELYLDATPSSPEGSFYYLMTMSNITFEGSPGSNSEDLERTTSAELCGGL